MSTAPGITLAARVAGMPHTPLQQYRDDGPLARLLGAALGRAVKLPPVVLALVGLAGLVTLVAVEGDGASDAAVAAAVAWLIFWTGISSGRLHSDRFAWALPALVRAGEYGGLIWIAANAGESSPPAAFALIAVLAFRHYELVYRTRYQGAPPPAWLYVVAGGWEGRLVLAAGLLAAGALPAGLFILAGLLGALFVTETVLSWVRHSTRAGPIYEDEEDEGD